jgi:hypothetical protein
LLRLQDIVLLLKGGCNSLLRLPRRIWAGFIGFFKNNPHFIAPTVTAFATFVIAIYAIFTYSVQRDLKQLQATIMAMQTEPRLSGTIRPSFSWEKTRKGRYHYGLTNIGSDTAWSVFARGQMVILCDTMLIYPETYLFGYMATGGVVRGAFSRRNAIAPAESQVWGLEEVVKDFVKLSNLLNGVILVEVDVVYWGDSPIKRYYELEHFIYNKMVLPDWSVSFEKLTSSQDRFLRKLSSLKDARKIACLRFGPGSGPAFYIDLFGEHMFILSNPIPSPSLDDFQWTYRDTFIVLDSTIEDFLNYRRQFPEYRRYEQWLKSK